jgi:hypothetical protein
MTEPQLEPAPSQAWYSLRLIQEHYLALLDEYEQKIAEYQRLAVLARQQIGHAEALLSNLEPVNTFAAEAALPYIARSISDARVIEPEPEDFDEDSNTELNVLPQWQGMPRLTAVKQIFERNRGKVLHPEFVMHELYGDVPDEHRLVLLDRVRNILNRGKHKNLWFKVPNSGGCYTWNLKANAG